MRMLVCGGAGFIGSNFIHHVLSKHKDTKVVCYDKLTYAGNLENLKGLPSDRFNFVQGDICDAEKILPLVREADYVINFAAETHVDRSIHIGSRDFVMTNVVGTQTILDAVRISPNVKKFLQVSTDEVYGSLDLNDGRAFDEMWPFEPNVPYSAAKAGGDMLCRSYFHTFGTPVIVTHCTNNYGPFQFPEKLIPFSILRVMEGKTIALYGDGKHVRDWIYVLDHCEGLELALLNGKPGETYNFGGRAEKSNSEIAKLILKFLSKSESMIELIQDRPGHDRRYAMDPSKAEKELGWKINHKFEEALPKTIKWYQENAEWVENLKKRGGQFNPHIK
ncbi:MAG TPA: dTDP-glucose 4,6-dehydratase [archaeon]|nr:dTDP-glucose 4,6-dehydratase [archaeon]